jgi:hypothetical protein
VSQSTVPSQTSAPATSDADTITAPTTASRTSDIVADADLRSVLGPDNSEMSWALGWAGGDQELAAEHLDRLAGTYDAVRSICA